MRKTSTKLLVIAITTAAIIEMATTTSLSVPTPAFAKLNCNADVTVCSGGGNAQTIGTLCGTLPICKGGTGGRTMLDTTTNEVTHSGGGGLNGGISAGGFGDHSVCDFVNPDDCSVNVGGVGQRP
jgi:hypothetical protein